MMQQFLDVNHLSYLKKLCCSFLIYRITKSFWNYVVEMLLPFRIMNDLVESPGWNLVHTYAHNVERLYPRRISWTINRTGPKREGSALGNNSDCQTLEMSKLEASQRVLLKVEYCSLTHGCVVCISRSLNMHCSTSHVPFSNKQKPGDDIPAFNFVVRTGQYVTAVRQRVVQTRFQQIRRICIINDRLHRNLFEFYALWAPWRFLAQDHKVQIMKFS